MSFTLTEARPTDGMSDQDISKSVSISTASARLDALSRSHVGCDYLPRVVTHLEYASRMTNGTMSGSHTWMAREVVHLLGVSALDNGYSLDEYPAKVTISVTGQEPIVYNLKLKRSNSDYSWWASDHAALTDAICLPAGAAVHVDVGVLFGFDVFTTPDYLY